VLFGKADLASLSEPVLRALSEEVPFVSVATAPTIADALVRLKLVASKSAVRRLIEQGGVYVNGERATAATELASARSLQGGYHLLRKGSREYGLIRVGA
ncbi:MAG TPA: S4 domain-containing protein, partial [Gemmatimonadaceae bacterium]|nr:S4 domain-containing protein [Gemmatimonadaceae bacterium]